MVSDKNTVIIKPNAYYKMLIHVLRFGSKVKRKNDYREVMGILIGHLEGEGVIKDVVIEEAIPISHGGSIEVAFAPEDYVTFSMVDAEFAEKGWFSVGWYHSHPGLKIFFSSTDIRNQLGWQTPNPSAVGIVFDHTYLEKPGDMGFRTFRLNDPSKGQTSNYHEVKSIVEPPDNLEYYIKLMELINNVHTKEPPILEINEMPDLFGDISIPSPSDLMVKIPELNSNEFISTIQNGISSFIELSIHPLLQFLNNWSKEITKRTVDYNLKIRDNLASIKENISKGISNLQKEFKFSLKDKLNQIEMFIDDKFEEIDDAYDDLKNNFENMKNELKNNSELHFEEKFKTSIKNFITSLDNQQNLLIDFNKKYSNFIEKIESQNKSLKQFSETVRSIENSVLSNFTNSYQEILNKFTKNTNKISGNLTNLSKETKKILSDLKAAIILLESSKNPLKDKIKTLEAENKALQKEMVGLKTKNEQLNKKFGGGD